MAAALNDFEARVNLALCYVQGIGIAADPAKGFGIMKAAAEENSPLAQTLTAHFYEKGIGVEKDEKTALRYYLRAAKQGEPLAKRKLKDTPRSVLKNL